MLVATCRINVDQRHRLHRTQVFDTITAYDCRLVQSQNDHVVCGQIHTVTTAAAHYAACEPRARCGMKINAEATAIDLPSMIGVPASVVTESFFRVFRFRYAGDVRFADIAFECAESRALSAPSSVHSRRLTISALYCAVNCDEHCSVNMRRIDDIVTVGPFRQLLRAICQPAI